MRSRRAALWSGLLLTGLALTAAAAGPVQRGPDRGSVGLQAGMAIRALDGGTVTPFAPSGQASVIFFLTTDCPISNSYAPEIQRVCREYGPRGVGCSLMYEDVEVVSSGAHLDDEVRRHLQEYRYAGIPAAVDRSRAVASRAKASVTPTAVVVDRAGGIRYRGRIDNFYAALGKPRQQVTEHDLRDALDAVLAGRPVPRPETDAVGCFIVDPALLRR